MAWQDQVQTLLDAKTDEELGVYPPPELPTPNPITQDDINEVLQLLLDGESNWGIRKYVAINLGKDISNQLVTEFRALVEAEQAERYDALEVVI